MATHLEMCRTSMLLIGTDMVQLPRLRKRPLENTNTLNVYLLRIKFCNSDSKFRSLYYLYMTGTSTYHQKKSPNALTFPMLFPSEERSSGLFLPRGYEKLFLFRPKAQTTTGVNLAFLCPLCDDTKGPRGNITRDIHQGCLSHHGDGAPWKAAQSQKLFCE